MKIKICGLTNIDDALAAIDAGADYLGFNFYPPSPRYISPAACEKIISNLQSPISNYQLPITTVGIFVNATSAHVAKVIADCGLALAQVHGEEPPEYLAQLGGRAFKAFRGGVADENYADFARVGPGAPAFLLDAHTPGAYGGTGHTTDWVAARALASRYPIFLAGGLTPENVAAAIEQVHPWGVDVASGVESAPGRKDPVKVRDFIQSAREQMSKGTGENISPLLPSKASPPAPLPV